MTPEAQDLLRLISEYQLAVLGFVKALCKRYALEEDEYILRAVRSDRKVPTTGTLDDRFETRFRFHGSGCAFESDRGEVDFDFGPGGRHDGFDGWRLWIYAQSQSEDYPMFQRLEIVESVLGELVTEGMVERPGWLPGVSLCYLRET